MEPCHVSFVPRGGRLPAGGACSAKPSAPCRLGCLWSQSAEAKHAIRLRSYRCSLLSGRMRPQEVQDMRRELVAKEVLPAEPKKGK
jgi:hypothetical protein